jgi:nucleoside-diphosphate-sugar epimerase
MKILIAGGAGFIGSVLVPKLKLRKYQIDVADLCWFENFLPADIEVKKVNLFDLTVEDLKEYEQLIFLAGVSNDPMAEYSPKDNFIYNSALPAYLCFIAKKAGLRRFIYAGSCSVYGYTVNELYDEESPTISTYPYGISKLQGEQAVMQMKDDNFSVICFRQGTVCGYSPRMRFDLVINTMFKSAIVNSKITINNAAIWRPILSIKDAVSAYIRAIEANYEISGIFNIASANYTLGELGDIVKEQFEKRTNRQVSLEIKNVQDYRNYKVSFEKSSRVLGFTPKYNAGDIVNDLVDNIDKYEDYDNPLYYNIQVFKSLKEQVV